MGIRFRVVGSGSTGNATLVEGDGTFVLIDAGLGPRSLAERLQSAGVDPASLTAVLVTHEHGDHARGAAAFSAKWGVRLAGSHGTYAAAGFGACGIAGYDVLEPGQTRSFGTISVTAVPVPHDAAGPLAFVVSSSGDRFGHATDFGHISPALVRAFRTCDAVLIESNYDPGLLRDGSYPWSLKERILSPHGHLSNADVARFLAEGLGDACRRLVLAHLSQKNNHPELARMAAEESLARRGRANVQVGFTGPEGTGWIDVSPPCPPPDRKAPRQLRLF